MAGSPDLLFEYLRDILYAPGKATLDLSLLDDAHKKLGQGLQILEKTLDEVRGLSAALARGDFDAPLPARDNELAAPLKNLHSSLRHLTWQTQQVAKGDYSQRVDFMGDFSEAFNTMVKQLEQRQADLERELLVSRRQSRALQHNNDLLEAITNQLREWIVVVGADSGSVLFRNRAAETLLEEQPALDNELHERLAVPENLQLNSTVSMELALDGETAEAPDSYYAVSIFPIHWRENRAVAFVLQDISENAFRMKKLESYAYTDPLTQTYNRHYGMQTLQAWLREAKPFVLCFADLDNLKYVNDTFGHQRGDQYIISAAQLLKEFSPGAVVCRLGGDEFMVLAPGMEVSAGEARMAALRRRLHKLMANADGCESCGMSYGVVACEPGGPQTSSELLETADRRMYRFKRQNKVMVGVAALRKDANTG